MMQLLAAVVAMTVVKPIPGELVTAYDPPAQRWNAGHRGVDLAGQAGQQVKSMEAGTVAFVGKVAGKPVVTIRHGELRSTYEPVVGTVREGQSVDAGQVIGVLQAGHESCHPQTCLHLGLKRGDEYLNPVLWNDGAARLVGSTYEHPNQSDLTQNSYAEASLGNGSLTPDVNTAEWVQPAGVLTSKFGMHIHPILGRQEMHTGIDLAQPCGHPINAVAAGTITFAGWKTGTGWTVIVSHNERQQSVYGHASRLIAKAGQSVQAGQKIALIGSTGWSTGCHLHLEIHQDGHPVDPESILHG